MRSHFSDSTSFFSTPLLIQGTGGVSLFALQFAKVAGASAGDDELSQHIQRLESEIAALKQMIKKLQRTTGAA